jgi:hypothetical protein
VRVAVLPSVSFERSSACERLNGRIAALLATTALVAVTALVPDTARAQNLVLNPGFETNTTCAAANWTSVGTCTLNYEYTTILPHSGTQSLAIGDASFGPANISQAVAVAAGR